MEVLTQNAAEEQQIADYKVAVKAGFRGRGHFTLPNTLSIIDDEHPNTERIQFHSTVILEIKYAIRTVTLTTGGWTTATTKSRMNVLSNLYGLGFKVFSQRLTGHEDSTWFIRDKSGQTMIFCEGIEIDY